MYFRNQREFGRLVELSLMGGFWTGDENNSIWFGMKSGGAEICTPHFVNAGICFLKNFVAGMKLYLFHIVP